MMIFAFAKVNGQPFHNFLINFIATIKNPKLKIWRKTISDKEIKILMQEPIEVKVSVTKIKRPIISSSNLSELSLIVDTGGVYQGEGIINFANK